ncbi:hypothetical protein ASE09_28625 [Streptomyces sp. Root66D1]|nr:hypothetical protein ASD33_26245 [Streptomyces sp. Root1304]KRA95431.1 hypothetical protein ASE09_28625 [Streptomyces sp. Root66D1]
MGVHRQEFARFEKEALGAAGELAEVRYSARLAADLDDVAALDRGRGDLDRGSECTAGGHAVHEAASGDMAGEWQGQTHAS